MLKKSLGFQIVIALLVGILAGLFFGPYCSLLRPIGNLFVGALSLLVLPYIAFSLMHGLGTMTPVLGKRLLKNGWIFLLLFWGVIILSVYLLSILIPSPQAIVFTPEKSTSSLILAHLFPANPIYDIVNNLAPAVALISLGIGIAIMHLSHKEPLLGTLERMNAVIDKLFFWITLISPIGVFAHIADVVGTVSFYDLSRLEFYVICTIALSLFITFWVIPTILTQLTSLNYREIIREFRAVCLLAFAIGLPAIAFPFIIKHVKKIGHSEGIDQPDFHSKTQTIIPLAFSFGQIGNYTIVFFVLFLAFYFRHPLEGFEQFLLPILALPASFGPPFLSVIAISFLIPLLGFPNQAIGLFTEIFSVTLNFTVLVNVASIYALTLLVLLSSYGLLRAHWKKLLLRLSAAFAVFAAIIILCKYTLQLGDNYRNLYGSLKIKEVIKDPVSLITSSPFTPCKENKLGECQILQNILQSGILKVGYSTSNIPFCYLNGKQEIVGYDIAFAYQLARDLDCRIEFVPLDIHKLDEELEDRLYDIAMSAILMDERRLLTMDFSHVYIEQDTVLVVPEKNKNNFLHFDGIRKQVGLRIGAIGAYEEITRRRFPLATVVPLHTSEEFVRGKVDAILWSLTPAFSWVLSHPGFVIIDFYPKLGKKYFAYPIRLGSYEWTSFLNNWLDLKKQSGFTEAQHRYWIEGELPTDKTTRWSILRNVLHWVD